jgi:hypothetical protein
MYKKFELFIIVTVSLTLIGSATLNGMSALAQTTITNVSEIGGTLTNATELGANVTGKGMTGATYGGVDIDSKSGVINCNGEIKGPAKTEGIQADAFVRDGKFAGFWIILGEKIGQDKGGADRGGWTDGNKYQITGVEQYDDICKAKLPNDITLSGDCGTGVEIKYATVDGNSDTFKGNARCYLSMPNFTSKAVNMTGTEENTKGNTGPLNLTAKMHELQTGTHGNKTGNATEPLNLTAKMHELQTGTHGNKTGNATEPLNLTAKMHELQTGTHGNKTGNATEPLNLTAKMHKLQK